ncbi:MULTISPECIES: hypothetical protein [unclassified Streptomyces]|uniref:hypothetical protein n=1 Tax=unclassified Streptomyces TaxID=2593676 RepID=UPI002DD99E25|nr:hypothetical protein [Streptomyces sp. NBC_01775]WSB78360.1 hypothetical protein OHB04_23000 [Streptomyces sp. NBC_01775]WSS42226.1 hypothetical protein OG220_17800 [Streptomyces sp. NBC_01187]
MFLELLQALGTFFGGLGALVAATTQLLTFLKKKDEGRELGHGGSGPDPWMIPAGQVIHLATAA